MDRFTCVFSLITEPQGKEMLSQVSVSHSVHNRPHGYTVTAHSCYGAVGTHPTGMLSCFYEVIDLPVLYLLYLYFNNCQEGEGGKLKHFVAILHLSIIRIKFAIVGSLPYCLMLKCCHSYSLND